MENFHGRSYGTREWRRQETGCDEVFRVYQSKLADFPLSQLSKSFTAIQLRLPMESFRPKLKLKDVRVGLMDLTTGKKSN